MKQLRAVLVAACLAITVLLAGAHAAHAAPPRPPDSLSCNIVVTYDWSGVGSNGATLRSQAAIQDTKSSDGTYCYSRAIMKYWTTSGSTTVTYRHVGLFATGSGTFISGSVFDSTASVSVGTSPLYVYAPWKDPCVNFISSVDAYNGAYAHAQTFPSEYRC